MLARLGAWLSSRRTRRQTVERVRYAAAQADKLGLGWAQAGMSVNDLVTQAAPMVRAGVQQLVRDFPPFHRAVNNIVAFQVGTGIVFQSRVYGPDGRPDQRVRQRIEECLTRAYESMDISASPAFAQDFNELQSLAKRQDAETGEFLGVWQPHRDRRGKYLRNGLALYETHRLTDFNARPQGGGKIIGGVEHDPRDGRITAFHVADDGFAAKTVRIPAEHCLFGFDRRRPGQLRGISDFACAVLIARSLGDAVHAEVDAFNMASKFLAMVETPDIETFQRLRDLHRQDETATGRKIERLENAVIEYLRPGERVTLASNTRGGEAFEAFSSFLLRLVSIASSIPYEILTGDYSGMNYTTLRVARNDFAAIIAPHVRRHVRQFCRPVVWRILDDAVLEGRLDLPGYWADPWRYREGQFVLPGMRPLDPLREAKAASEAIKAGLRSPQEVILDRGADPEEVLDEIKTWREMCAERGLDFESSMQGLTTALANNPAAVAGEEDGDSRARPGLRESLQ